MLIQPSSKGVWRSCQNAASSPWQKSPSDESNPGFPSQWCLRHYGFVGASFPGKTVEVDGYTLEPGKPLTLKFRVRVSDVE